MLCSLAHRPQSQWLWDNAKYTDGSSVLFIKYSCSYELLHFISDAVLSRFLHAWAFVSSDWDWQAIVEDDKWYSSSIVWILAVMKLKTFLQLHCEDVLVNVYFCVIILSFELWPSPHSHMRYSHLLSVVVFCFSSPPFSFTFPSLEVWTCCRFCSAKSAMRRCSSLSCGLQ